MSKGKTALVTGVTGQDGAYLARHLLDEGYRVIGTTRRADKARLWRLEALEIHRESSFVLSEADVSNPESCVEMISSFKPDLLFNLSAQSSVAESHSTPFETCHANGFGPLNLLEAIRTKRPDTRFFQAGSSEIFAHQEGWPLNESSPMSPSSTYGASKLFAYNITELYREEYGLFAANGVLFGHESPLRGLNFVTRKISNAAAEISLGVSTGLQLGALGTERDWGYAPDFVEGYLKVLMQDFPDTFVFGTGHPCSVRDFTSACFAVAGIDLIFQGSGEQEIGVDSSSGRPLVTISPALARNKSVQRQVGDSSKAFALLGWSPSVTWRGLAELMVESDLARVSRLT